MRSLPFALSVHHFISSVGADAGFASLIGLALLVLLYFAHARETATLRSRADDAGLRVQDLEAQLADLADQVASLPAEISVRATGPRVAAASGGGAQYVMAGGGRGPVHPAAPAGVGAPALASATRLIPMPDFPVQEPEPATVDGESNGTSRIPVAASAGTMQRPVPAPGSAGPRPPAGPGRAAGGPPRPNGGQARPAGGPRSSNGQNRPGQAGRPVPPMRPAPKRSRIGRAILALLVVLVAAAVVVAAVFVLGKSNKNHKPKPVTSSLNHRTNSRTVYVKPSTVTVSVLNGTDVNLLAAGVWNKLAKLGFQKGAVTDAANQTETTSTVAYLAPSDKADALAVAQSLKLSPKTVQAVSASTKQVACTAASTGCSSQVFVTVGSDQAAQ